MRLNVRYSEAFKLQVVRDLETGKYANPCAAGRAYGVKGADTVGEWVRRYGKDHLLRKAVRVMKADEQAEVKALRKRVKDLEKALASERLDHLLDEAYLEIACRTAGIEDLDGFKKKHAGKL